MNENKLYIRSLLEKGLRADGRKLDEFRKPIKVEYGVSSKSAEGSARVIIGSTEVVAGVKMEIGEPYPDIQDEGTFMVNVELTPIASPEFELGPPDVKAIELARVVDRGVRESKMIDTKKLCIKKGEQVWMIMIDIYPINDGGNLFDAASLAALAALRDAKFPKYDEKEDKVIYELTNKKLPFSKLPVECTVVKINEKYIVDPTYEEEDAMDARLTVSSLDNGNICALQKGGKNILLMDDVVKMIDLSINKSRELRKLL